MSRVVKNRRRAKRTERRVAQKIGGLSIGIIGGVDVLSDEFVVEVKSRKKVVFDKWFMQLKEAVKRQRGMSGKIPLIVCHIANTLRYYAILDLDDLLKFVEVIRKCKKEGCL